jgi:hypothetical protein
MTGFRSRNRSVSKDSGGLVTQRRSTQEPAEKGPSVSLRSNRCLQRSGDWGTGMME